MIYDTTNNLYLATDETATEVRTNYEAVNKLMQELYRYNAAAIARANKLLEALKEN